MWIWEFASRVPEDKYCHLTILMFKRCWLSIANSSQISELIYVLSNISPTVNLIFDSKKREKCFVNLFSCLSGKSNFGIWKIASNLNFLHFLLRLRIKFEIVSISYLRTYELCRVSEVFVYLFNTLEDLFFLFWT